MRMISKTRLFQLKWKASVAGSLAAIRFRERNTEGIMFANGLITLNGNAGYNDLTEMHKMLKKFGAYTLTDMAGHPLEVEHAQTA